MNEGMNGAFIGLGSVLLTYLYLHTFGMSSMRAKLATNEVGKKELKYSLGILVLCGIMGIMMLISFPYTFIYKLPTDMALPSRLFLVLFGLCSGVTYCYVTREVLFVRVQFDDKSFRKISPSTPNEMRWDQVFKVTYDHSWRSFLFDDGTNKIRISRYMAGLSEFFRVTDSKVKPGALIDIRSDLDFFLSD
jgi:hypothetical protein